MTTQQTPERGRRSPRRKYRPASFAPNVAPSEYDQEELDWWTERELSLIENALREHGELKRSELSTMLGCKYWGPGQFARALRSGVDEGRFRRVRRGVYAPA